MLETLKRTGVAVLTRFRWNYKTFYNLKLPIRFDRSIEVRCFFFPPMCTKTCGVSVIGNCTERDQSVSRAKRRNDTHFIPRKGRLPYSYNNGPPVGGKNTILGRCSRTKYTARARVSAADRRRWKNKYEYTVGKKKNTRAVHTQPSTGSRLMSWSLHPKTGSASNVHCLPAELLCVRTIIYIMWKRAGQKIQNIMGTRTGEKKKSKNVKHIIYNIYTCMYRVSRRDSRSRDISRVNRDYHQVLLFF